MGPLNEVKVSGVEWRLGQCQFLAHWLFLPSFSRLVTHRFTPCEVLLEPSTKVPPCSYFRSPSARTLGWPHEIQGHHLLFNRDFTSKSGSLRNTTGQLFNNRTQFQPSQRLPPLRELDRNLQEQENGTYVKDPRGNESCSKKWKWSW